MRTNTTRDKILQTLTQQHLQSLDDLQTALPEVDFSTIYRNIQQLVADAVVKTVVLDSKVVVYELATHQPDHFVCDDCDRVEVVDVPTTKLGKRVVRDVVVRGQCEDCTTQS